MKKLLIVESPAKIKTIAKFLGPEFKIMSTLGHIMDLPQRTLGITMTDDAIDLDYVVIEKKEKIIADICKEASRSDEIYLAPDPDREGEIIAWHIEQAIKKVIKNKAIVHRISFNEITKTAVQEAIQNQDNVDLKKVGAQQARRVLDRWVGYEVSPILWKKIAKGLSAGRVQSVALRLICDREDAIRAFKPEEYWSIHGEFKHKKSTIVAALTNIGKEKAEIKSQKEADAAITGIKKESYIIDDITDKKRSKKPLAPFMTSTLQQAAFNQLGFSVKKTMQVAQNLYEGLPLNDGTPVALITYMRTDSKRISETALAQARSYIKNTFSKEYLPKSPNLYEKATKVKTQDAHEAVRPIDLDLTPDKVKAYLPKDALRLYELIWKRFVACQMTPAEYAQRQVTFKGGEYIFKVTGSTLLFDGFLKVYAVDDDEEKDDDKVVLPEDIKVKNPVDLEKILPKQHFTQPPPRYTEGSLVKEMEKEGIGRPSTYATILTTIQTRSYTTLDTKKRFTPTELGMMVTKLLVENLPEIMDLRFTARMEEDLDKIAQGDLERDKLLRSFYKTFQKDLKKFGGSDSKRIAEPTNVDCPSCKQQKLILRFGKAGEFLGCPGYPECKFTCNFERLEDGSLRCLDPEKPKILDINCPTCGKPLREIIGRYGPFIACSGYPECKYIHQEKASFKCPTCKKGDMVKRRWRGGTFWGCSNYPTCKTAIFSDIEDVKCPKCKALYLIKKFSKDGTITLSCPNKECDYKVIKKSE